MDADLLIVYLCGGGYKVYFNPTKRMIDDTRKLYEAKMIRGYELYKMVYQTPYSDECIEFGGEE